MSKEIEMIEKMKMETSNMVDENIKKIGALFPNCISEKNGKKTVNFDMLRQLLSDGAIEGDEAYEFCWVGKKASIIEANKPIRKTLRPEIGRSKEWNGTRNLYIEGDNLDVLKLLQEGYLGEIKVIYIDPPYNTGHDFVYPDSFIMDNDEYNEGTGYFDDDGNINYKRENSTTAGKYHSDWCSMMYSRLALARNLLTDDGVIFISIDDNEQVNLTKICDEIFGSENRIGPIIQNKQNAKNDTINIQKNHEFILIYRKMRIVKGTTVEPTLIRRTVVYRDAYEENGEFYYINDSITTRGEGGTLNARPNLGYTVYYNPESGEKIAIADYDTVKARNSNDEDDVYETRLDMIQKGFVTIRPPKVRGKLGCWTWALDKFNEENKNIIITGKPGSYAVKKRTFVDKENIILKGGKQQYVSINETNSKSIIDFSTNDGTNSLKEVLNANAFSNPKNVEMIKYLLGLVPGNDYMVLDFFSGSATTVQAIFELNAEDNGRRQFIMVQIPEPCESGSDAAVAGYANICEIGEKRIAESGQIIKDKTGKEQDYGYRVLKLDDTNMNDVYYSAGDYTQGLLQQLESNIKSDRTGLDLFFGCILDWGLPLSLPYKSELIDGFNVHTYNDGDLIACFDENIPEDVIKTIAKRKPLRAVFRDSSFPNSPAKINVEEIFKLLAPDTRVKVI